MRPPGPVATVDIIIENGGGIVLIDRKHAPCGWALPGGFVDEGEKIEDAARREAKEETGLDVTLTQLLGVYSDPRRDPRQHTLSVLFVATAAGAPRGSDDALAAKVFAPSEIPPLCFDHDQMVADYKEYCRTGRIQRPG
jgi:ADP-ribose pyrophosphatase YjhB (NUDIX family)